MCVSAVIETDVVRVERLMRATRLAARFAEHPAAAEAVSHRRIEPNALAPVVRMGHAGRLVIEPMRFKSYVIKRETMTGDMFADSMLTRSHGLIVLRLFSEWVSALRLVAARMVPEHEVHCAFNRFAPGYGTSPHDLRDRMLLANFAPHDTTHLVVPVLFSRADDSAEPAEFVVVSEEPADQLAAIGVRLAPVTLGPEAAFSWLSTAACDDAGDVDFLEVLRDGAAERLDFSLFKTAG